MEVSGQLHILVALLWGKESPIGGRLGPKDGLDAVAEKKYPCNAPAGNRTLVFSPQHHMQIVIPS